MALFEQTPPSRGGSRFGKLSSNMFFTRNTAQPKRVRHIEGLNGALICSVNDDPSVVRSTPTSSLSLNRTNLPALETPHRLERLVPPTGFWSTYGVIQDTDRWRKELARLASSSGLGIEKDEQRHLKRPTVTADQHASRSGAHYSNRTGRFNEGTAKSRGRTGSKHGTGHSDMFFNVPENEREMWMLQVLCQLLGTSNLEDVQSWLVSASQTEKEQARTMISSALQGLKESDRTPNQTEQSVDFNSLSTFVEKQKNEEKQASQKYINDSLNRPATNDGQQINNNLSNSWANLANNNYSNTPAQNVSTYKQAYQNHNRRSRSAFDLAAVSNNNENLVDENQHEEEEEEEEENNEQIDTIQLDDDRQRHRSTLLTNVKKQSKKPQSSLGRSSSSFQQKHRVDSLQLNDDGTENKNEDEQEQETIFSPIKVKESSNEDDNAKSRKIRDLQNKLSRQEEEAKKQLNELQSKQSRLENALKILVKQTSSYSKHRQPNENTENSDAPVVNVISQSEKDNNHRQHNKQQETNPSDNRPRRSYAGIWKPDASTLHRLQGN